MRFERTSVQFFNYIKVFLHLQDMVCFGVVASHDCEAGCIIYDYLRKECINRKD